MSANSDMLSEIREVNLSYLLLAQRLLREDKPMGMFRMGISDQLADVLTNLSLAQTVKLAASNQVLCRFRFDDHAILSSLADKGKDISTGLLTLIFGSANPQDVALAFLGSSEADEEIRRSHGVPQEECRCSCATPGVGDDRQAHDPLSEGPAASRDFDPAKVAVVDEEEAHDPHGKNPIPSPPEG